MVSKKRLDAALLMAVTVIAAACSSGGSSAAPSAAAPSAAAPSAETSAAPSTEASAAPSGATASGPPAIPGDADLVIWADDKRAAALKPLADQYGTDNGVKVVVQAISKDIFPTFLTASKAGTAPDVVVWAHDVVGNLVANSAIDPVQGLDATKFDPLAVKGMTFDGQVYGVPYSVENIAAFRNTEMVDSCPSTMEDLVAAGKALVGKDGVTNAMALQVGQAGDAYHIYPLFSSGGGAFFEPNANGDPDPDKVAVDSAGSIEAGTLIGSIGEKGDKALTTAVDDKNAISLFATKKTPFLVSGPWAVADIKRGGVNYDICPIPGWKGKGKAGPFIGVNGFYLASKGAHKTLAQDFATSFLTTKDVQVALYTAEPRRPALLEALTQVTATDPDIPKFQAASEGGTILPAIPEMGQVWGPFGVAEAAIVKGDDPKTALESAAKAIRDGIAKQ
jgi:arabinogalactan oligomer/maltooligosaccharide transport system substrate-binding protein